jgi:PAS domain S-box-containing protein
MQDRPDGAVRILIVDDRLSDPRAWQTEAEAIDARIAIRCADSAATLQNAVLEGNWACVLCRQSPARMSLNAVLSMVQVLDPQPAVVLYPDAATAFDRRRWLNAGLRATGVAAPSLKPTAVTHDHDQFDLDLGAMPVPSMFGNTVTFSTSDVEALRALRDSEERFRTLTEIAPVGIFLTDAEQRCVYVNGRWSEITGLAAADARGLDWRVCLQTEGATLDATALFAADPTTPVSFENPIEKPGRPTTWVIGQMRPYRDSRGDIVGHVGVITDITDRKSAELAIQESEQRLRELSTHMTSAEERQRAVIAREIHDDIGSSLTGMKIDVMRLKQLTTDIPEAQDKLAAFTRLLDSSAASSVRIAKALRPSILDDGIVPAIEWQLREFAKRMDIDTEFVEPEHEPVLTPDQSIALFRVVQEALNNVAKHAQAKHVDVVLFARANELTLEIRDDGRGLPRDKPAERIERSGGFGITGMRERVLSLGGWMDVTGAPGKGTTVMVGIPMRTSPSKQSAGATS